MQKIKSAYLLHIVPYHFFYSSWRHLIQYIRQQERVKNKITNHLNFGFGFVRQHHKFEPWSLFGDKVLHQIQEGVRTRPVLYEEQKENNHRFLETVGTVGKLGSRR